MKINTKLILLSVIIPIMLPAQTVLGPFEFISTPYSGVFQGRVTIDGNPAVVGDYAAAFDEDGNCAGACELTIWEGEAYINLPIYGDDPLTNEIDEGMNSGEHFILRLWVSLLDTILIYSEEFPGWFNNSGAPIPPYNDPYQIYNFNHISAELSEENIPNAIKLHQAYPNPFNTRTNITFEVKNSSYTHVSVINITGQPIKTIWKEYTNSGKYSMCWDGTDEKGTIKATGIYFVKLESEKQIRHNKLLLLK